MKYYVIQVTTGEEEKFKTLAADNLERFDANLRWPLRTLSIRRKGKMQEKQAPLFPGYIFLQTEKVSKELFRTLRSIPGFYRFLKSNNDIQPLGKEEERIMLQFLRYGEIIPKSTVIFNENDRIQVIRGPMKGLEGMIVKVDKRKKRAKIKFDMYENAILVDLGFEILSESERNNNQDSP